MKKKTEGERKMCEKAKKRFSFSTWWNLLFFHFQLETWTLLLFVRLMFFVRFLFCVFINFHFIFSRASSLNFRTRKSFIQSLELCWVLQRWMTMIFMFAFMWLNLVIWNMLITLCYRIKFYDSNLFLCEGYARVSWIFIGMIVIASHSSQTSVDICEYVE